MLSELIYKFLFSGQKFALMELKMMCAYLLRNFYMESIERYEDFERSPDLILRPQKDIHVKFIPIELIS